MVTLEVLELIPAFANGANVGCGAGTVAARHEGVDEDGEDQDDGSWVVSPYAFASDVGDDVFLALVSAWCPCSQLPSLVLGHHVSFVVCVPWLYGSGTRFSLASLTVAMMWLVRISDGW